MSVIGKIPDRGDKDDHGSHDHGTHIDPDINIFNNIEDSCM